MSASRIARTPPCMDVKESSSHKTFQPPKGNKCRGVSCGAINPLGGVKPPGVRCRLGLKSRVVRCQFGFGRFCSVNPGKLHLS